MQVADIGDVWVNLYNLPDACRSIKESFLRIIRNNCIPLVAGTCWHFSISLSKCFMYVYIQGGP